MITDELRNKFEQAVFKSYFISQVAKDLTLNANTLTLAQLCVKDDDGDYTNIDVNAMWFGFLICHDIMSK